MATRTIYFVAICDTPCGHAHTTFYAAEKCAKRALRDARKNQLSGHFPHPDLVRKWAEEKRDAAEFVKSRVL